MNTWDKHAITPLMSAANNGHQSCIDVLIKAGADVNDHDYRGNTALMYAVTQSHSLCVKNLDSRRS